MGSDEVLFFVLPADTTMGCTFFELARTIPNHQLGISIGGLLEGDRNAINP